MYLHVFACGYSLPSVGRCRLTGVLQVKTAVAAYLLEHDGTFGIGQSARDLRREFSSVEQLVRALEVRRVKSSGSSKATSIEYHEPNLEPAFALELARYTKQQQLRLHFKLPARPSLVDRVGISAFLTSVAGFGRGQFVITATDHHVRSHRRGWRGANAGLGSRERPWLRYRCLWP